MSSLPHPLRPRRGIVAGAFVMLPLLGLLVSACSGDSASTEASASPATGTGQVLPAATNPITNTSSEQSLVIDEVLVENNVDANGKAADDHLEIALRNVGSSELTGFEIFYTFDDPTTGDSESYYLRLTDTFSIPPGERRVVHFDGTGKSDHFPDNQFSIYHTSRNALDVTVEVSADGAAPQTASVQKDPGGDETAD